MSAERAHNLPTPLTTFVGRDAELSALAAALREARLVTRGGPGRSTYATRSTTSGAPEANGAGRRVGGPASPRPSRA